MIGIKIKSVSLAVAFVIVALLPAAFTAHQVAADGTDNLAVFIDSTDGRGTWRIYHPGTFSPAITGYPFLSFDVLFDTTYYSVFQVKLRYQDTDLNTVIFSVYIRDNCLSVNKLDNGTVTLEDVADVFVNLHDGQWHNIKIEFSASAAKIYVDNSVVFTNSSLVYKKANNVYAGTAGTQFYDGYDLLCGRFYLDNLTVGNSTYSDVTTFDDGTWGGWEFYDITPAMTIPQLGWADEKPFSPSTEFISHQNITVQRAWMSPLRWNYKAAVVLDPDADAGYTPRIRSYFENATRLHLNVDMSVWATADPNDVVGYDPGYGTPSQSDYWWMLGNNNFTELSAWNGIGTYSIKNLIEAGKITTLHTMGTWDNETVLNGSVRELAQDAISLLSSANKKLIVWTQHGAGDRRQQWGGNNSVNTGFARYHVGDNPENTTEYNIDLWKDYGIKFFWGNTQTNDPDYPSLDDMDFEWYGYSVLLGESSSGDALYFARSPPFLNIGRWWAVDGSTMIAFQKPAWHYSLYAGLASRWDDLLFDNATLNKMTQYGIVYAPVTHLKEYETDTDGDGTYDAVEGLETLALWHDNGTIDVLGHGDYLLYDYYYHYLNYSYNESTKTITIHGVNSPFQGDSRFPSTITYSDIKDLYLTFDVPDPQNTTVVLNEQVLNVAYNQAAGKVVVLPPLTKTSSYHYRIDVPWGVGTWTLHVQIPSSWDHRYVHVVDSNGNPVSFTFGSIVFTGTGGESYTIYYDEPFETVVYPAFIAAVEVMFALILISVFVSFAARLQKK